MLINPKTNVIIPKKTKLTNEQRKELVETNRVSTDYSHDHNFFKLGARARLVK